MKRWVALVALLVTFLVPVLLTADEPPHLQFVRGLRERGDNDLALEYLLNLQKRTQPPLPPELKAALPLEIAKTQADAARNDKEPAKRAKLQKARDGLAAFVKANPSHERVGEAQLELARVIMEQARSKAFIAADTPRDNPDHERYAGEARKLFDEAVAAFTPAIKSLDDRFKTLKGDVAKDPEKQEAQKQHLTALYLNALSHYEKALTYSDDPQDPKRAERSKGIQAAYTAFEPVANQHREHGSGLGWLALAMRARCDEEMDKGPEAEKGYQTVLSEKPTPVTVPAQRLVRYYRFLTVTRTRIIQVPMKPPMQASNLQVRKVGEDWLTDNKPAHDTREGQHLRFVLAQEYLKEVRGVDKAKLGLAENQQLVDRAVALFEGLESSRSDYADAAEDAKLIVIMLSGRAAKAVNDIKLFDECYVKAQVEARNASEALEKLKDAKTDAETEKLQKEAGDHYQTMLDAARRGVALMPPDQVGSDKWERTFGLLYFGYLKAGDHYRAAVIADYMARKSPKDEAALKYALFALRLYHGISERSASPLEVRRRDEIAKMMETRWPNEVETDTAREIMGTVLFRQANALAQEAAQLAQEGRQPEAQAKQKQATDKNRAAVATWEKVSNRHSNYALCSYQAGYLYWNMHIALSRAAKKPLDSPSPERDKAIQLLQRALQAAKTTPPAKMNNMEVLSGVLLSQIHAFLNETDKALAVLDPLVARLAKKELPEGLPDSTSGEILGLTLRLRVQKKDTKGALEVLDILKAQGTQDLGGSLTTILMNMGAQLRAQITALEKEPAKAKELKDTKDNFRAFLDHIRKTLPKLEKASPVADYDLWTWIGSNYAMLGDHKVAAEVFTLVPDPGDPPPPLGEENDPEKVRAYQEKVQDYEARVKPFQRAQLFRLRALRQAKLFEDADKMLEALMQKDWAKKHPEFRKEQILVVQDQKKYSGPTGAITQWNKLIQVLEPHRNKPGVLADVYNESYFHLVECIYFEAQELKGKDDRLKEEGVRKAAQVLSAFRSAKSDFGGGENQRRVEDFLNDPNHKDIKEVFDKLQGVNSSGG